MRIIKLDSRPKFNWDEKKTFTIEMSLFEAAVLHATLLQVGGVPEGPRGKIDQMRGILETQFDLPFYYSSPTTGYHTNSFHLVHTNDEFKELFEKPDPDPFELEDQV